MIWVTLTMACILFIYNYIQISKPYIYQVNLKSEKINKGLNIVQITDFHSNKYINLDKLFNNIKDYKPDIIVLTGDLIDYKTTDLNLALDLIKRTKGITKNVYFVAGNHENRNIKYPILANYMKKLGITVLYNESKEVKINGEKLNIAGVEFQLNRKEYVDAQKHINPNYFTLLLSHSPNRPIKYLTGKEDLILSGHTHGGQVRLPLIGPIIAPGQGLFPKFDKGIIKLGNATLYIDSGLGNRLLPIRLFNRVQISNIVVRSHIRKNTKLKSTK